MLGSSGLQRSTHKFVAQHLPRAGDIHIKFEHGLRSVGEAKRTGGDKQKSQR